MDKTAHINQHQRFHAHVYFDASTQVLAEQIYQALQREFELSLGRFHQKLVGPHPCWSFQILFFAQDYEALVTWLEAHRQGLNILIHADTGDDLRDHTEYATWLGEPIELNLDQFKL